MPHGVKGGHRRRSAPGPLYPQHRNFALIFTTAASCLSRNPSVIPRAVAVFPAQSVRAETPRLPVAGIGYPGLGAIVQDDEN